MSAGARRKPNASALVGMVAAASGRAAVSTTAILRNFSFMTHPLCLFRDEPALDLEFANLDVKQGTSRDSQPAISRYLATW